LLIEDQEFAAAYGALAALEHSRQKAIALIDGIHV